MFGHQQLQSFVTKFMNLRQMGSDAQLHVECKSGKTYVKLRLCLNHLPQPPQHDHHNSGQRYITFEDKAAMQLLCILTMKGQND